MECTGLHCGNLTRTFFAAVKLCPHGNVALPRLWIYSYVSCDYWFVQIVLHHRVAVIVSCKYLKEEVICVKSVFHFHTQWLLSFFLLRAWICIQH